VPVGHAVLLLAPPPAPAEAPEEAVVLLLEPQPARASVLTRAMPVTLASCRRDWSFTIFEPLHTGEVQRAWVPAGKRIWRPNDVLLGDR
jgi:hypothetical protein